jgi:hypothetical protein
MPLAHLTLMALVKSGKFFRNVFDAIIEAREHQASIEAQLYRGRYRHVSKFDDDLPIVR